MQFTRRNFLKAVGLGMTAGLVTGGVVGCGGPKLPQTKLEGENRLKLGMASYSLRQFSLDEAIEMTSRLGLEYISLKSMHLPYDRSEAELQSAAATVRNAGLNLYGGGVIYMGSEEDVNNAFEYANTAGFEVIIGVPGHDLLDLVNQKVQEYDIKVAIHNHGPGDEQYPSPESVYERVQNLDERIGLCIDIGHTKRLGIDPAEQALKYASRLHDVHVKDVNAAAAEGETVEIGRGVIDIPRFLRTLLQIDYQGVVALEYEKDPNDPLPGAAESVGFLRGVLNVI